VETLHSNRAVTPEEGSAETLVRGVNRLRFGRPRNRGFIPDRDKIFISFLRASRPALGPTEPPNEWVPAGTLS